MVVDASRLDAEFAGLDALEAQASAPEPGLARRAWAALWPKLAAVAIVIAIWQAVVWAELKPPWVLPGPGPGVRRARATSSARGRSGPPSASPCAGRRWATPWPSSSASVIGVLVARFKLLRTAVGSLITGLQTMPSIAWFPLAILLFGLKESAILFVVVLGAAPSIANGLLTGVD